MERIFKNNRAWAKATAESNPEFFTSLGAEQWPHYLWIGCSDSRVPSNIICGLGPGEIFVHRNVANLVVHTDLNCLSVLQYAVEVLKVTDIIVCGHYDCGGVRAASQKQSLGLIDNWLRNIMDVYVANREELDDPSLTEKEREDRLCELNVQAQVANLSVTTIVQNAWECGQKLAIHGFIYGLHNGLLRDLKVSKDSMAELPEIYQVSSAMGSKSEQGTSLSSSSTQPALESGKESAKGR